MSSSILFENKQFNNFFRPLCSKNAKIYYECISLLIKKSGQVPVLYESDAKDVLILYFRNNKYNIQNEENPEDISIQNKSETEMACDVLQYFRKCGWLAEKEMYGRRENTAIVSPYCSRVINALDLIFGKKKNAALTNNIFNIHDILKTAFEGHARQNMPYSNILAPAMANLQELHDELSTLKDSIHSIMRSIMDKKELNELGQLILKNKFTETFFRDYFALKKNGTISSYIAEIQNMLRELKNEDIYRKMIEEYMAIEETDVTKAKEVLDGMISSISGYFSYDYVKNIDHIEKKINSYYRLLYTRFYMVISGTTNLQTLLDKILMMLKDQDDESRNEIFMNIKKLFHVYSHKYIGNKSINRKKKTECIEKKRALFDNVFSDEEKIGFFEKIYNEAESYDVKETESYFEILMANKNVFFLSDITFASRYDAMMIVNGIINSSNSDFSFEAEYIDGIVDTPIAKFTNMKFTRKKK